MSATEVESKLLSSSSLTAHLLPEQVFDVDATWETETTEPSAEPSTERIALLSLWVIN